MFLDDVDYLVWGLYYTLPLKQIMLIYLACKHINCEHIVRCTFFISTYAPHHTGSQTESLVVVPEEPEEQLELQPNNVPFDREVGRLFGPSKLPAAHCTRAGVVGHEGTMIRPKSSRSVPGYMWFQANSRFFLNSWLGDQYLALAGEWGLCKE
jgi:hypothetical protein